MWQGPRLAACRAAALPWLLSAVEMTRKLRLRYPHRSAPAERAACEAGRSLPIAGRACGPRLPQRLQQEKKGRRGKPKNDDGPGKQRPPIDR